jgi:hypothetical protein
MCLSNTCSVLAHPRYPTHHRWQPIPMAGTQLPTLTSDFRPVFFHFRMQYCLNVILLIRARSVVQSPMGSRANRRLGRHREPNANAPQRSYRLLTSLTLEVVANILVGNLVMQTIHRNPAAHRSFAPTARPQSLSTSTSSHRHTQY